MIKDAFNYAHLVFLYPQAYSSYDLKMVYTQYMIKVQLFVQAILKYI